MEARLPSLSEITEQLDDLEGKVLDAVRDAQGPAVEYAGKAAGAVAARLPEDRPEALARGIDLLVGRVDFAKKLLDAQVALTKAVLDATVAPVRPRPVAKVKAPKAA